jgi:hypothetical protein
MDEADDLERQLARANRRRRMILGGIIGAVVIAACSPCVILGWNMAGEMRHASEERERWSQAASEAQIREVDEATRAAEAQLAERASRWRSAMAQASTMVPRPDLGACPIRLPVRQPASAQNGFSFGGGDGFDAIVFPGRQGFPHAVAHGGVVPQEPPRVALARDLGERLRESIRQPSSQESHESTLATARELDDAFWTYDVVFFPDAYEAPRADVTGTSFSPGYASGVAVLYDYESGSALCAGEVSAETTSTAVDYQAQILNERSALQSMLDSEFQAEIERAIARGIRYRAGEPSAAEEPLPEENL